MEQAIREAVPSASGPDGIPFDVYKEMGPTATDLFLEVANSMLDQTDEPDDDFNLAYMVCISKGAEGFTGERAAYCSPGGTRPISIVDASNRLLASIFKATLEKNVGHLVHRAQKGFVAGRKMLRNVLEIDIAAQKSSVRSRSGAMLLFDFAAAFPSMSHDMMWEMLEAGGIDENFIAVIKLFYQDNRHLLKLQGSIFAGVVVHSGVRQGCPLSGLLFALCVDVLLERIGDILHAGEALGAFADDIAIVVDNLWTTAPALQVLFKEFHTISALRLNVKKTIVVPLWAYTDKGNIARLMKEHCPGWADVVIDNKAKYLGFLLGPGAREEAWNKPLAKFESRVNHWSNMQLGIAMNTVAFNIYIIPVLEFVAQLLVVTERVRSLIGWAMRKVASGPGSWVLQRDLENLTSFGFKVEFRTIELTAQASKLRVLAEEAKDAAEQQEDLERTQAEYWRRPFGAWHSKSLFKVLLNNKTELQNVGVTPECIRKKVALNWQLHKGRKTNSYQKVARTIIKRRSQAFDVEERIRAKTKRWKLKGPPAHVAQRIARNLKIVGRKCRPCISGMFFRTLWNGWPTTARMRSMQGATGTGACLLGCHGGEDRIEHYLVCEQVWRELSKAPPHGISLNFMQRTRENMLLAAKGLDETEVAKIATACYAIARTESTVSARMGQSAFLSGYYGYS